MTLTEFEHTLRRFGLHVVKTNNNRLNAGRPANLVLFEALGLEDEGPPLPLFDAEEVPAALHGSCFAYQQGDEMACSCGLRWDAHDPDPPVCPRAV